MYSIIPGGLDLLRLVSVPGMIGLLHGMKPCFGVCVCLSSLSLSHFHTTQEHGPTVQFASIEEVQH